MQKRHVFLSIVLACIALFLSHCKPPHTTESTCKGAAKDGSIIVKAYGYSFFQRRAINNAKKAAVMDVLFKGIKAGDSGCPTRPIIDDPGKVNSPYFKDFLRKNGSYLQYVNLSGDNLPDRSKVGLRTKAGMYVVVDHRRLQKRMVDDKQAKGLNSGF